MFKQKLDAARWNLYRVPARYFKFDLIDRLEGAIGWHAGWVRVNGKLVFVYKSFFNPPLFSERYGYYTYTNLGLIRVRFG